MKIVGKVSWFGGPNDDGVAADEPLAFIHDVSDQPSIFLDQQPPGTSGLARRLDPETFYIACRWSYDQYPREMLLENFALVRSPKTGNAFLALPSDWGPGEQTGRVADVSPSLLDALGLETDDEVEVIFPAETEMADRAPIWLEVMRAISGTEEVSGSGSNAKITGMADYIALKYPEMEDYCAQYTNDDIAWCGLTAAFCVSVADVRPPFGETDTDKFLWALSWADDPGYKSLSDPLLGCIVVMEREGGGHVTFFEREENGMYVCRGGNQSDAVNEAKYDPDTVVGLMWPHKGRREKSEESERPEKPDTTDINVNINISIDVPPNAKVTVTR